jgi:carbonic anhydrase
MNNRPFSRQTFAFLGLISILFLESCGFAADVVTKETLLKMSPSQALQRLIDGNNRFSSNRLKSYRLDDQRFQLGKKGAYPPAVVLCGTDSRVSPELIFNQGLGDIFCLRSPASIVTPESLGAMEHAAREIGSKVIVLLMQTKDPYIEAAIDDNNAGNFASINYHIRPTVQNIKRDQNWKKWKKEELIALVTREHLQLMTEKIRMSSAILRGKFERGEMNLVTGIYNIETGKVVFLNE